MLLSVLYLEPHCSQSFPQQHGPFNILVVDNSSVHAKPMIDKFLSRCKLLYTQVTLLDFSMLGNHMIVHYLVNFLTKITFEWQ